MGLSVCPSAVVEAPVERVWELLTRPEGFDDWTDATLVAAEPEGTAQAGQKLHFVTTAVGWKFAVTMDVLEVDVHNHRLHLLVDLPFGVVNDETISIAGAGERRTLVRFG